MTELNRRTMLRMMTAAPVAALVWTETEAEVAAQAAGAARQTAQRTATAFKPKFFTAHQWATVSMLSDIIIPTDDRSGSATDAGVPEFMDFMMVDQPARQSAMRGGLAWLDRECNKRFDKTFVAATDAQRKEVLDEISWPRRAKPEVAAGVAFFNSFRDLTASGFFSSKVGVQDLGYIGNTFVPKWTGCPEPVLKKLGLTPGSAD